MVASAGATTAAGVSVTGATGASSFLAQAARVTANREAISRDFFMVFSLVFTKVELLDTNNNYR
jgi:hypothetical protein